MEPRKGVRKPLPRPVLPGGFCCGETGLTDAIRLPGIHMLILVRCPDPFPLPNRHGHHPSGGGTPSSRGLCASDEPRANARNGRDLCNV